MIFVGGRALLQALFAKMRSRLSSKCYSNSVDLIEAKTEFSSLLLKTDSIAVSMMLKILALPEVGWGFLEQRGPNL